MKSVKQLRFLIPAFAAMLLATSCADQRKEDLSPTVGETGSADVYVDPAEATQIAEQFIQENENLSALRASGPLSLNLVFTDQGTDLRADDGKHPHYYIFNIDTVGFVIVSGSEASYPVLAYSNEGTFQKEVIPVNMQDVLSDYTKEIDYAWKNVPVTDEVKQMRQAALHGSLEELRADRQVGPLLGSIRWNQTPYYNQFCPVGCPVGCVATATCQIMRYWEYPDRGRGTHTSTSDGRYADYDHALNWENMPKAPLRNYNREVAQFCYDVAIGVNMQFGRNGSGAWQSDVPRLLKENYNYDRTARYVDKSNYTTAQWKALLRAELDANRPIQYAGYGNGGGHSFVCDGYNTNGYFHFNWGWGGSSDGWFLLTAMNPGSLGAGGGTGGFNRGHNIVIGIQPPGGVHPDPVDPDPIVDEQGYPKSSGKYFRATYIRNVRLANVNSTTGGNGYRLFSNPKVVLTPGKQYSLSLTPGFSAEAYPEYWAVWIDFNGDKKFSDDEYVAYGTTNSSTPLVKTITIPNCDKCVGETRMRVSMKWGSYPKSGEAFEHGEVEDYVVLIQKTSPTPNPTPDPNPEPDPQPNPVDPDPTTYPQSYGRSTAYTYIKHGEVGDMQNISSAKSKGYADYSKDSNLYVVIDKASWPRVTLHTGYNTNTTYWCYWRIWIDMNKDGKFSSNEKVLETRSFNSVFSSLRIPATLDRGSYRMRVSMSSDGAYPESNAVFNNGEVEDYTLVVR